jgi:hypothetical protein
MTVTRYLLRDTNGQPLPEVAQEAADVLWRQGGASTQPDRRLPAPCALLRIDWSHHHWCSGHRV